MTIKESASEKHKDLRLELKEKRMNKQYKMEVWRQTLINGLSGVAAGAAGALILCPLDVVKTRLQAQGLHKIPGVPPKYNGTMGTIRVIYAEESFRSFFRGLTPTIVGLVPTWCIYFVAYERLKAVLHDSCGLGSNRQHFVNCAAAMGAGVGTAFATSPVWVVRTRLMVSEDMKHPWKPNVVKREYESTLHAIGKIYRQEGWRGFFKGVSASALGASHVAIQFPIYEYLKKERLGRRLEGIIEERKWIPSENTTAGGTGAGVAREEMGMGDIALASALSKVIAGTVTYPHEVVRTRMQNTRDSHPKLMATVSDIMKREGVGSFYNGLRTNLYRVVPGSAITLITYEYVAHWLEERWVPPSVTGKIWKG